MHYDMKITMQAKKYLRNFWIDEPFLRKQCVKKYGYDPIENECKYWEHGIAEGDHKKVLFKIIKNFNTFSLPLAREWAIEERN